MVGDPRSIFWFVLVVAAIVTAGCDLLPEYRDRNPVAPDQSADGFVRFLRADRFPGGELDDFPRFAVVLYDHNPERSLGFLGYSAGDFQRLEIGYTMPNHLYLVEAKGGRPRFALNIGTPGAGGVSTQAAELSSLGAEYIVHMGTCMKLGDESLPGPPIISVGSYKDGAAVMLSTPDRNGRIAFPHSELTGCLAEHLPDHETGVGYTSPIIYYQPESLIRRLLVDRRIGNNPRIDYLEMEQAPFFETCFRANVAAASVVVGSDSTFLNENGVMRAFADGDAHREVWDRALGGVLHAFATLDAKN